MKTGPPKRIIPSFLLDQIIIDYNNKIPIKHLYHKYQISPNIIKRSLCNRGIELPLYKFHRITQTLLNKAEKLYLKGFSLRKIANILKLDRRTLATCFRQKRLTIYRKSNFNRTLTLEILNKIKQLYIIDRVPIGKIAEIFHTSRPNLIKLFKEKGIHVRNVSETIQARPPTKIKNRSYCGYYKKWFFRSLNELSYVMMELEAKNLKWSTGEGNCLSIFYKDENKIKRRYHPDFIIKSNKLIVECKPKRFWKDKKVLLKKRAAIKIAREIGYQYLLIDYPVNYRKIGLAYFNKEIKFLIKSTHRFDLLLNKFKKAINEMDSS